MPSSSDESNSTGPRLRFSAADMPHPVPPKLRMGWEADAAVHGWFGGSVAQLEYIEAQSMKISLLQKELLTSRRVQHAAIAARLRDKSQPNDKPQERRPMAAPAAPKATTPSTPRRAALRRATPKKPEFQETRAPPPQSSQPQSPLSARPEAAGGRGGADNTSTHRQSSYATAGELALEVSKQRKQIQDLMDRLNAQRLQVAEVEDVLAVERKHVVEERTRLEAAHAKEKSRADRLQGELLRVKAERDQCEWLLKRRDAGKIPLPRHRALQAAQGRQPHHEEQDQRQPANAEQHGAVVGTGSGQQPDMDKQFVSLAEASPDVIQLL